MLAPAHLVEGDQVGMGDDDVRAIAIYEVKDGRIAKVRFLR